MSTTAALVVPTLLAIPISLAAAGAVIWLEYMIGRIKDNNIKAMLAAEADAIEAAEADQTDRPLPPGVTVSRPNRRESR